MSLAITAMLAASSLLEALLTLFDSRVGLLVHLYIYDNIVRKEAQKSCLLYEGDDLFSTRNR